MKAIDVVRARASMHRYLCPRASSEDESMRLGLERLSSAMRLGGCSDKIVTATAPFLLSTLIADDRLRPEDAGLINYFVAGKLTETIDRIAEALPDDTLHDEAPPPSQAGFCVLEEPIRFVDVWGHECTIEVVVWGPALIDSKMLEQDGPPAPDQLCTTAALWTRQRDDNVRYVFRTFDLETTQRVNRTTEGWFFTRVTTAINGYELGPARLAVTDEERERLSTPDLPVVRDIPNLFRHVHALWLVLAGATCAPGQDREVHKDVQEPGKSLEKTARKKYSGSATVSYVYAGAERRPTPLENVGSRGPIGVRYWRNGFTKRVVLDDGTVKIRRRRGTWVNDHKPWLPVSERTKVRIAQGTLTKVSDVLHPEKIEVGSS